MAKKDNVMEKLLAEHEDLIQVPEVGEIITGHILDRAKNAMYVDLGPLGAGVIYKRELMDDANTHKTAKIGDPIQATVLELENEEGYFELSIRSATHQRSWDELTRLEQTGDTVETEVIDANKGGLMVRLSGVQGFLPVSQLAPDHYPRVEGGDRNQILERLKDLVGEKFQVKVIGAIQDQNKLIVSEKAAVGEELNAILEKMTEGDVIEGEVAGVAQFGAFIKFEVDGQELEGLVHISELAWQRIDDPADIIQVGEKIKAKVIGKEGLRISLSIKQLKEDPWASVGDKYKVGDKVKGEVLKVTPFGGFVKLDEDIHGLVHASELPEEAEGDSSKALKAGDKVEFTIISLDPSDHRLGLTMKEKAEKKDEEAK